MADFYLTSSEGYGLEEPRACEVLKKFEGKNSDGYLLVSISPPLIGQKYGLGGDDISEVLLASRHEGESIDSISKWPAYVHVALPLGLGEVEGSRLEKTNMKLIGWGEIYRNREDIT